MLRLSLHTIYPKEYSKIELGPILFAWRHRAQGKGHIAFQIKMFHDHTTNERGMRVLSEYTITFFKGIIPSLPLTL